MEESLYYKQAKESYLQNKPKQLAVSTLSIINFLYCIYQVRIIQYNHVLYILIGMYLADMKSGLVHIFLDNKRVYSMKKTLDRLAYSFQYSHHKHPTEFIQKVMILATRGQLEILLFLSLPTLILAHWFTHSQEAKNIWYTYIAFASMSQTIHGYAHMNPNNVPHIIKLAQRFHLLLSPEEHRKHHKEGIYHFSIVNGWSNWLLDIMFTNVLSPIMVLLPEYFI